MMVRCSKSISYLCIVIIVVILVILNANSNNEISTGFTISSSPKVSSISSSTTTKTKSNKDITIETFLLTKQLKPCNKVNGVVRIPSVKKGINNQRMRIVQDITTAMILGAAIELPKFIYSRINCHNNVECYKNYEKGVLLWEVFDKSKTIESLIKSGVCLFDRDEYVEYLSSSSVPSSSSSSSSSFSSSELPESIPLNIPSPYNSKQILKYIKNKENNTLTNQIWSLGNEIDCCTKFFPDNKHSLKILRKVNGAFQSIKNISNIAKHVIQNLLFQKLNKNNNINLTKYNKDNHIKMKKTQLTISLHWRQDGDFVKSDHSLNTKDYLLKIKTILMEISENQSHKFSSIGIKNELDVILLGDLTVEQSLNIEQLLNDNDNKNDETLSKSIKINIHTKKTLLAQSSNFSFSHNDNSLIHFDKFDDPKGQIDFEIGLLTDYFIGSPFSSMSVLLAFQRDYILINKFKQNFKQKHKLFHDTIKNHFFKRYELNNYNYIQSTNTIMIHVDVKSNLARIFGVQFPYFEKNKPFFTNSINPCKDIVRAYPGFTANVPKKCMFIKKGYDKKIGKFELKQSYPQNY